MPEGATTIEPAGGRHAIEVMSFGVEWTGAIDSALVKDCAQAWESDSELKSALPAKSETFAQVFRFGDGQDGQPVPTPIIGVDFQKFNPDGIPAWTMSLRPNFLAVTCREYESWTSAYSRAKGMLQKLVHLIIERRHKISGLGLQYQDAFRICGNTVEFRPNMLFNSESAHLPRAIFDETQNWHVHQGWFRSTVGDRRMLNVTNIDLVDTPPPEQSRLVRISSNHRTFAYATRSEDDRPINWTDADPIFDAMHEQDKSFLRSVLNHEISHRIKL